MKMHAIYKWCFLHQYCNKTFELCGIIVGKKSWVSDIWYLVNEELLLYTLWEDVTKIVKHFDFYSQ